jgi:adenylate cyclase
VKFRILIVHVSWILLCVLAVVSVAWVENYPTTPWIQSSVRPLQSVRFLFRDWKFRFRGPRQPTQPIVIVDIDDASLEQIGRWPWRRDFVALLIEKIFSLGASRVGLDIVFSEPQESIPEELQEVLKQRGDTALLKTFDFDAQLTETIRRHRDRVFLAWMSNSICIPKFTSVQNCPVADPSILSDLPEGFSKFALAQTGLSVPPQNLPLRSAVTVIPSIASLQEVAKQMGFVNTLFDPDGLIRRITPFLVVGGNFQPSLSLAMAQDVKKEKISLSLGKRGDAQAMKWQGSGESLPLSRNGLWNINLLGPGHTFPYISARELFLEEANNRQLASALPALLSGATVLIGVSALAVGDLVPTPFDPVHPGVELHANVIENILTNSLLNTGSEWISVLSLVALLLTVGALCVYWGMRLEAVPMMGVCALLFLVIGYFDFAVFFPLNYEFNTGFLYLQILGTVTWTIASRYTSEQKDKKFLRTAFSKYLDPAVVDSLVKDPKQLSLGGRRETVTVLFSDIRGFTTFSEKLDANKLSGFLNEYLGMQTDTIFRFGGTLDKYIGDAIMAFWGAPVSQPDHAKRACEAAIAMAQALEEKRTYFLNRYGIDVQIGIGLHTGEVSVGNMGSSRSFSYTVIGDSVNLASRLEGATKHFGVEILTTQSTLDAALAHGVSPSQARPLATVRVKGKQNGVGVAQLLSSPCKAEGLKAFEEGLHFYQSKNWQKAKEAFQKSAHDLARGGSPDTTSTKYVEKCEAFLRQPPTPDSDLAWALTEK